MRTADLKATVPLLSLAAVLCWASPAAAAEGKPTDDPAYQRAQKAAQATNWIEAQKEILDVESRYPDSAEVNELAGFIERRRGHMESALEHYQKALQIDPKNRRAHEGIGETYLLDGGKLTEAQQQLTKLGKLCKSSCAEYKELRTSIDKYKAWQAANKKARADQGITRSAVKPPLRPQP
jgi:predicted Zn-dependent protease